MSNSKKHISQETLASTVASITNNELLEELQQSITDLEAKVNQCPFNVGYVAIYIDDTDPNDLWTDTTWEKIEGQFLLGSSDDYILGETGGDATHTLTTDEMPSHYHNLSNHTHSVGAHSHGLNSHTHGMSHTHTMNICKTTNESSTAFGLPTGGSFVNRVIVEQTGSSRWSTSSISSTTTGGASGSTANSSAFNSGSPSTNTSSSTGSGGAHNNMPPYIVVNMWKRVA